MRRPAKSLFLLAVLLVAVCLTAGCGSTISSVVNNLPSRTATTTAGPDTPTAAPTTPTTAPTTPTTAPTTPTTAPTTAPPTTSTVTVTASPTVTTPSPTASPTSGTSNLLWLWIVLAAAVLIGLIAWIATASRRRSAKAAGWRSRLIDAYAKGSALHDAMSVAESTGLASGDAGARWADIQRRADDLTQTLYALREAVPDPDDQARIADVLASLQAVRSAMDAERAPGAASPELAQVIRSRLYAFEMSLRALRGSDQEFT
jgi:hypothetical protein